MLLVERFIGGPSDRVDLSATVILIQLAATRFQGRFFGRYEVAHQSFFCKTPDFFSAFQLTYSCHCQTSTG